MADPHNPQRYGELWPQHRIDAYLEDLEQLRPHVTFSGGFAWHFLSPEGHSEHKHAHDHKDADLFVPKASVATVMGLLRSLGFEKARTIYDKRPSAEDFRRYERTVERDSHPPFRLTLDFFVGDHPTLDVRGWKVIRPDVLLSFYSSIHSSDQCWAVTAAHKLLQAGEQVENLVGNRQLVLCAELPLYFCRKCAWHGQFPKTVGAASQLKGCGREGCGYLVESLGLPRFMPKEVHDAEVSAALKCSGLLKEPDA